MKQLHGFLEMNQYVTDPLSIQTQVNLQEAFDTLGIPNDDITVMSVLIQYPTWKKDTDFYRFIKPKVRKQLRKDPKTFFFFDASTEGFSTIYSEPYYHILYKMIRDYSIDPKRVFFVSSNMRDQQNLIRFNMEEKISDVEPFNVISYHNFERMIFGVEGQNEIEMDPGKYNVTSDATTDAIIRTRFKKAVKNTRRLYRDRVHNKVGLALSRLVRPHRTYSAMDIFHSEEFKDMYVSHATLNGTNLDWLINQPPFRNSKFTKADLSTFKRRVVPLIVDTDDFKTNHATALHSNLNDQTLFQIVQETHIDDWQGTSLFYSEKTFRAIYHMEPFVIWGQPGCNKRLVDYGYKTYRDWFDLSFDDIQDPAKRWEALWKEVRSKIKLIREMKTVEDQIQWKFKNENVLMENFRTLLEGKYSKDVFKETAKKMREIADATTTV